MVNRRFLKKIFSGRLSLGKAWLGVLLIVISTMIWGTVSAQDDKTARRQNRISRSRGSSENRADEDTVKTKVRKTEIRRQITIQEDTIPDSLLHPRWKIQRTMPIT